MDTAPATIDKPIDTHRRTLLLGVASAALWVGAAMGVGWLFRMQVAGVLAWMTENTALAAGIVGALLAVYVLVKAWQRWRLTRFVAASRITVDELGSMLDGEEPPHLVDVGSKLAHGHRPRIPGAVLLDLEEIDTRAHEFPSDRDIVLYCACPNEESARRAAQILHARGFRRARPLAGGLDAWIASGRTVEQATATVVLDRHKRAA